MKGTKDWQETFLLQRLRMLHKPTVNRITDSGVLDDKMPGTILPTHSQVVGLKGETGLLPMTTSAKAWYGRSK